MNELRLASTRSRIVTAVVIPHAYPAANLIFFENLVAVKKNLHSGPHDAREAFRLRTQE